MNLNHYQVSRDCFNVYEMIYAIAESLTDEEKDTTPLPVLAVPDDWYNLVCDTVGHDDNAVDDNGDTHVLTVAGCTVVNQPVNVPLLIMHDGKTFDVRSFKGDLEASKVEVSVN